MNEAQKYIEPYPDQQDYLIVTKNTSHMLKAEQTLRANHMKTELVPAPPESGTVCAIAIKISEQDVEMARELLQARNISVTHILKDQKMKLAGLFDETPIPQLSSEFTAIMGKIAIDEDLDKKEIEYLLSTQKNREVELVFHAADRIRKEIVGDTVEIRGAIEFSNYCCKGCAYCGINVDNTTVQRYSMTEDEILAEAVSMRKLGIRTVILQSGEDPLWTKDRLGRLLKKIKETTKLRITLSVGERSRDEYELFRNAGADNYLLKIETTNPILFNQVHPDDVYEQRLQCSRWLKELGYLNASGNIVGLPGQTIADIADDVLYFRDMGFNMIGIGPFVPARGTPLSHLPSGDPDLVLRTIAVTRIVCRRVYIPATTALASIQPNAIVRALHSGANAFMLVMTPEAYRRKYNIYDHKHPSDLEWAQKAIEEAGRVMPKYIQTPLAKQNVSDCMEREESDDLPG